MTASYSPAERLRGAAWLLRCNAEAAAASADDSWYDARALRFGVNSDADAGFAALVSPPVGVAVADWLRLVGDDEDETAMRLAAGLGADQDAGHLQAALAVADALLGDAPPSAAVLDPADAIDRLAAITDDADPESNHDAADVIVLACVPQAVREAYYRAVQLGTLWEAT